MPLFRDSGGAAYEVRGLEGQHYNLYSSPRLSINAEFVSVPDRFQARVLPRARAATEAPRFATRRFLLRAAPRLPKPVARCSAALASQYAPAEARRFGSGLMLQLAMCLTRSLMRRSGTGWRTESCSILSDTSVILSAWSVRGRQCATAAAHRPPVTNTSNSCCPGWTGDAAELCTRARVSPSRSIAHALRVPMSARVLLWSRSGMSRLSIRSPLSTVGGVGSSEVGDTPRPWMTATRNALVSPNATVDCAEFRSWPEASRACDQLLRGDAPEKEREEWALLLTMPQMTAAHRFYFSEVQFPSPTGTTVSREEAQRLAHGLVGQRVFWPSTTRAVRASNRATSRQLARGIVEPFFDEEQSEGATTSIATRAAAGLTGIERTELSTLSVQGEGVIEGFVRHYKVDSLHSHEFRHSRFNCST
jgi:hypothetical protein